MKASTNRQSAIRPHSWVDNHHFKKCGRLRPRKKLDFHRVYRPQNADFRRENAQKFCDLFIISYDSGDSQFGFLGIDYRYAQLRAYGGQPRNVWLFGGGIERDGGTARKRGTGAGRRRRPSARCSFS